MSEYTNKMDLIQKLLQRQNPQASLRQCRTTMNTLKRSHGYAIEQAITCLSVILVRATRTVLVRLSTDELQMVLGTITCRRPHIDSMHELLDVLREEINYDRVDRAWGVNGAKLMRKLERFNTAETTVLFDISDQAIAATGRKEWYTFLAQLEVDAENVCPRKQISGP